MIRTLIPATALAALLPVSPARAQATSEAGTSPAVASEYSDSGGADDALNAAPPVPGDAKAAHPDTDQSIVITGVRRPAGDILGGVSVIDKEMLQHEARPSLGETLQSQPGVSASSFGPTASRPILRGLSGERVRILVDGIGTLDLSSSDPDHQVTINPLTAERIEVLRGPSALLFGSSAIGGVVNVFDSRIPRSVPTGPVRLDALAEFGSAADERSGNLSVDVPIGGNFVVHADGAYSKYDDLRIGGFVLSKPLREQALASPDPDVRALADLKGKLPNTGGRIADIAAGIAYVNGDTNVGVSVSRHSFNYGVPIRFSFDPAEPAEQPTIDGRQTRADLRANVPVGGFFKLFEFRGGISKYHHDELTPEGDVDSSFSTHGGELRADVVQNDRDGWGGTSGVQYLHTNVRLSGEEKYLPDSINRQLGFFTLQSLVRGPVRFEGGLRIESARLRADADPQIAANGGAIGQVPLSASFTPISASLGANYEFAAGWRAGLSLSHSERAPAIDELFANGPHGGSETFEIGDPGLRKEVSNGAELSLHGTKGPVHIQGSIYYSRFTNFIFQAPTGEVRDGLPVFTYREAKADYYGFELGADSRFGRALGIDWGGELVADAVRATIEGFGPAPQIPPFRLLAALTGSRGQVDGRLEVERVSAQHRTAPVETPTPGYTMVNASLDWHPFAANPDLTLSLQGNNLFDVDARRHTSLLKDFAPLAGRDIRLSARMSF
ncbi:MAG TPA: TonB-dependent receptor [Sphingomicrobium sp.]|nr:TonB-dependent receptor [Sphingomicrobium sp.]